MLTDELNTAIDENDKDFFIFDESTQKVYELFFRDPQVLEMLKCKPHTPLVGVAGPDKGNERVGVFPPAGILPCHGFKKLIAPFCYISRKVEEVYFIFRALYCKYFCQLHTISSDKGIVYLCKFFEDLLQTYEPEVCYHLNQLGINPLKTAFPWIFYSFIGYLEVSEVYLLWD